MFSSLLISVRGSRLRCLLLLVSLRQHHWHCVPAIRAASTQRNYIVQRSVGLLIVYWQLYYQWVIELYTKQVADVLKGLDDVECWHYRLISTYERRRDTHGCVMMQIVAYEMLLWLQMLQSCCTVIFKNKSKKSHEWGKSINVTWLRWNVKG